MKENQPNNNLFGPVRDFFLKQNMTPYSLDIYVGGFFEHCKQ